MKYGTMLGRAVAFGLLVCSAFGQSGGKFVLTGKMISARAAHTATLLKDGRVLIAGGGTVTAEIFDPATGTFTQTGDMAIGRYGQTATLLMDGRVLVTGGDLEQPSDFPYVRDCCLRSTEVYDPATGKFNPAGLMHWSRSYHSATLLSTGKVLIAGGARDPEIFDPDSGDFATIERSIYTAQVSQAFRLYSGKVLFVGGDTTVYDPISGNFESHPERGYLPGQASTLLANGQVLITGGVEPEYGDYSFYDTQVRTVERFDPVSMSFVETGQLGFARAYHTATALPDGRALIAGGFNPVGSLSSTEIYDVVTGEFRDGPGMKGIRVSATATLLGDGRVLIAGGWNRFLQWPNLVIGERFATAELFIPDPQPDSGCTYRIAPTSLQIGNAGGTIPITIETAPGCTWTVNYPELWVTLPGAISGTGTRTLDITVAPNSGQERATKVLVAGKAGLEITQGSANCKYSMSEGGRAFAAGESSGSIQVAATLGCAWRAVSSVPWISIGGGGSGTSNGTLTYQVEPNPGPARVGSLLINGMTYKVEQAGSDAVSDNWQTMAHLAAGGDWKTTITLVNYSNAASTARLSFFGDDGSPLELPLTFPQSSIGAGPLLASTLDRTLNAGATLVIESSGLNGQAVLAGWGRLQSGPGLGGFAIVQQAPSGQEVTVPATRMNPLAVIFDESGALATGIAIVNDGPSDAPLEIPISVVDEKGDRVDGDTLTIPAHGRMAFMLRDRFRVSGQRGLVLMPKDEVGKVGHFSLFATRFNGPAMTALPPTRDKGDFAGGIIPLLLDGGMRSTIYLHEAKSAGWQTLRFRDRHGAPLPVPVSVSGVEQTTNEFQQYLPLYTMQVVEIGSEGDLPGMAGSAELAPDSTQAVRAPGLGDAVEVIRWNDTGREIAVAVENRDAANTTMPFDHTGGNQSLVVITNRTSTVSSVKVNLRDETGALLQSVVLDLSGRGQSWFVLPDAYSITQGRRGIVEFIALAEGTINVFGLRITPSGVMSVIALLTDR